MLKSIYLIGLWSTFAGVVLFAVLMLAEIWRGDWARLTFLPLPFALVSCIVALRELRRGRTLI